MSRRIKDDGNGCLIFVIAVLGIPLFLLMEHPVIFFLVFLPLVCWCVGALINWFKKYMCGGKINEI